MTNNLVHTFRAGSDTQAPLALLVHGRAGNVSVMSTFSRSLPPDWGLVFVQAPFTDSIGGFSWWDIQKPTIKYEQQSSSVTLLTSFLSDFLIAQQLAPRFMVAIGFSQGAAMISILAQSYPEQFKALALLSGFIIPQQVRSDVIKPHILVIHGTNDDIISLDKVTEGIEHLRSQGYEVTLQTEDVGHKVGIQGMRLLKDWASAL